MKRELAIICTAMGIAVSVRADFVGQPILGPLTAGSSVIGNTLGSADDNDGFDSGMHIFDIWDGGDDVYQLNWGGGDLTVTLTTIDPFADNDLFVYRPGALDSTGDYSVFGSGVADVVTIRGAEAGIYYINVDSTFFSEGAYQLDVANVPAPGAVVVLAAGALAMGRRRRR